MALHLEGLEFLHKLAWNSVFEIWAQNEERDQDWQRHARERGFEEWRDWRRSYALALRLAHRTWDLYRVTDPMTSVPAFRGAPFRGWVTKYYGDAGRTPRFNEVAERVEVTGNEKVSAILASFPTETTVTGVLTERGVIVIEGTHRCHSLAIAARRGMRIETDLTIAVGSELKDDAELFASTIGGHRKGEPVVRRD